jgi:hypothetical protein
MGAAFSVKWSGASAIVGALILSFAWETTRRHRGQVSRRRAFVRAVTQESLGLVIAFVLIPLAVYMVMYLPWFNHFGWSLKAWWENQTGMLNYHRELKATALNAATGTYTPRILLLPPMDVAVHLRPVASTTGISGQTWRRSWPWGTGGSSGERVGRPFGPHVAPPRATGAPGSSTACLVSLDVVPGTAPQFFFYVLPLTPFMVLAVAYVLRDLSSATIVARPRQANGWSPPVTRTCRSCGLHAGGGGAIPVVLAGAGRQPDLAHHVEGARVVPGVGLMPTKQHITITTADGIHLAASLFVPDGDGPWPAILRRSLPQGRRRRRTDPSTSGWRRPDTWSAGWTCAAPARPRGSRRTSIRPSNARTC